jgi:hypothetical protein
VIELGIRDTKSSGYNQGDDVRGRLLRRSKAKLVHAGVMIKF